MVDRAYPKSSRPEITSHCQGPNKVLTHGRMRFLRLLCWERSTVPWGGIGVNWDAGSGVCWENLRIDTMEYQLPCGRPDISICQCLSFPHLKNPLN